MIITFILSLSDKIRYLITLLGTVGCFILALLPHSTAWIIIKILYFLAFISYLYLQFHYFSELGEHDKMDDEENKNLEEGQDWLQIENDQDVEDLFQKFLDNTLHLIKKILVSDTVALLFANFKKKEFILRHVVTSHESLLNPQKYFDILSGLPSIVLRNRTSLIENHLPEATEILPYYKNGKTPSNSFAAVPIYFKNLIIGVLCVDSNVEEAYSNEDLEILKNFGNLISVNLFGSNKLYEYESENWLANTFFEISQEINQIQTVKNLWKYLSKKIPDVLSCDRLSISRKINDKLGEILILEGGTGNLKVGKQFQLNEGMVGWVLRKNQSLLVEDFSSKENYVPRFATDEIPAKEYMSLLATPIANKREIIAAVCLESYRAKNFKEQQKRILQTVCNQAANIYLTTESLDKLKMNSYKDSETNLENMNAFNLIVPKEIKRSKNLKSDLNFLFLKLYFQLKENDQELERQVFEEFLSLTLPLISETDYIFRLFPDSFVMTISQQTGTGINTFARKVLETLCAKKLWAEGNAYDFYISIGIVTNEFLSTNPEELVKMGEEAIKEARLKGPNSIAYYREYGNGKQDQIHSVSDDKIESVY
jgi:transcriptional regulator with GAF, ATPase, and Fis domain